MAHNTIPSCSTFHLCVIFFRQPERITTSCLLSLAFLVSSQWLGLTDRRQPPSRKKAPCEGKVYKRDTESELGRVGISLIRLAIATTTSYLKVSRLRGEWMDRAGEKQPQKRYENSLAPFVFTVCLPVSRGGYGRFTGRIFDWRLLPPWICSSWFQWKRYETRHLIEPELLRWSRWMFILNDCVTCC